MKAPWFHEYLVAQLNAEGVQHVVPCNDIHQMRPCVWLKAKLLREAIKEDGVLTIMPDAKWVAQAGMLERNGNTPEEAMDNFDKAYYGIE